ncbi:tetratricopeptide repeat protein [Kroppenstedtia pulmonis]|uniref:Tetratricopeptide repeat protein n=1 Tax=Kroppenstedtia pulmonis TaxID=1380685 RepID=A0A7D3XT72_9BACL|nr:tetratricopeptide repeat protein [Kroppenstedtia pulmonis]QKG85648.1 tetratricopeptide repeat protein [Kroppenstedtia pulmonis]
MDIKKKGEWIRNTYEVIDAFPFVQGVLYFTRVAAKAQDQGDDRPARFVHGLDVRLLERGAPLENLLHRDRSSFFPLQGLFVQEGILYQVFGRLEGTLMAHHLYHSAPLALPKVLSIIQKVTDSLVSIRDKDQFTLVHPQNMLLTSDGVRFLYGGSVGLLPKVRGEPVNWEEDEVLRTKKEKAMDIYSLGALAYIMLTGTSPSTQGRVEPIQLYRNDVPSELNQYVMACLEPDPVHRPSLHELSRWIQQVSIPGDFQKKKDDPVYYLKPDFESLRENLFSQMVRDVLSQRVTGPAEGVTEWEGWQAGQLDTPGQEAALTRQEPKGERVWTRHPEDGTGTSRQKGLSSLPTSVPQDPVPLPQKEEKEVSLFRKKPVWIATTVLLGGLGTGFYLFLSGPSDAENAAKYYGESMKYVQNEKMDQAVTMAEQAVEAAPQDKTYLLHLADLYWKEKKYQQAVTVLERGSREIPDAEVFDLLAMNALYANKLKPASKAIKQAISLDPDNPQYHYHQGKIYGAAEKYDAAVRSLQKAIRMEGDDSRFHNSLATYLLKKRDYKGAEKHARQAVELNPEVSDYQVKLGKVYLAHRGEAEKDKQLSLQEKKVRMKELTEKSIQSFAEGIRLDSKNATAHYYLSISQYYDGDYKSAEKSAQKSLQLSPEVASFYYQYGVVLQRLDKRKEAADNYKKALDLDPENTLYKKAVEQIQ